MNANESKDALDRLLVRGLGPPQSAEAHVTSLEPSSGFVASVMERVQDDARCAAPRAPSPIVFPWRRAIPGICLAVLAVLACVMLLAKSAIAVVRVVGASSITMQRTQPWMGGSVQSGAWAQIGWVIAAVALALLPVAILRQTGGRGSHR